MYFVYNKTKQKDYFLELGVYHFLDIYIFVCVCVCVPFTMA